MMVVDPIKVLLIEDNPGDARLVAEVLRDVPGFEFLLETAHCLSQGLTLLEGGSFDVVLLDLTLSDSSGYKTFQKLHHHFPQATVVLLTGLDDAELGLQAVRDGAQDYLPKGYLDGNLLARTIRYAIERKRSADAFRKSQQLFEKTFSSLLDAAFIIDSRSFTVISCNPAASRVFGLSREGMIGQKADFLLDPIDKSNAYLDSLFSSGGNLTDEIIEKTLCRANGEEFYAEISNVSLDDEPLQVHNWVVLVRDISARKKAQETLRESEERYDLATRGANDGLWDWNIKKGDIYYSPRWKAMLGYSDEEIKSTIEEWFDRIHPDDHDNFMFALYSHLNSHTPHFQIEHRLLHRDGNYRWMLVRGLAVKDDHGANYRMAGSLTDVTSRKQVEQQLIHDAFHDLLTGLPNRALFLDRLGRTIEHCRRHADYQYAVLFLDLDRFKVINDSLGHAIGDQFLVEIAQALQTCLRSGDTIARFGGDEFVILLEEIRDRQDAIQVANRIQDVLAKPFLVEENRVFTSSSIGIVFSTEGYLCQEEVLRDADIAMYQAKISGRAQYVLFDTEMRNQAIARLKLEDDLRHAMEHGEFELYYQPIVSLTEEILLGFEALLRWNYPGKGIILPSEFIPITEETGLILEIGNWVLHRACSHMRQWQEQFPGLHNLQVSINISQRQFDQPDFLQQVRQVLAETGLDASCLNLEITENVLMNNAEAMVDCLIQLRNLGVGLHIDDFGTGYSSLSYLQRFPIDTLKIDYSFISRIGTNGDRAEIVKTILLLARELGVDSIAEGVENEIQLNQLRVLNCQYGQGFYIGKPMNAAEVEALLRIHQTRKIEVNLYSGIKGVVLQSMDNSTDRNPGIQISEQQPGD